MSPAKAGAASRLYGIGIVGFLSAFSGLETPTYWILSKPFAMADFDLHYVSYIVYNPRFRVASGDCRTCPE